MEDYTILENLFREKQYQIHFDLFKEVNIIKLTNQNKNDDFDNGILFNTASISSKMINCKDAYVLLKFECEVRYKDDDVGKKSIPKELYSKDSFEIVKNLKIQLNNVHISNEVNVNRSSLIDFVLKNSHNDSISYRNLSIVSSSDGLNITSNKFIPKDIYGEKKDGIVTNHFIDFEIPIFLKDISSFFNNVDILHFAEFNILINIIDDLFIASRE